MTTRAMGPRLAALLAAVTTMAAAGSVAAQPPTKARAGTTKTLLAECDYMVSSCGGSPYMDQFGIGGGGSGGGVGGGYGDSADGPAPKYVCDGGNGPACKTIVTERCTAWVIGGANGTVTVTVGTSSGGTIGAGATRTCSETVTTTETVYLRKTS